MDKQQNSRAKFEDQADSGSMSGKFFDSDDRMDRHETKSYLDSLEPQEFGTNEGVLNLDDPNELSYWAEQFQISIDELKSALLLQGNSIR